MDVQQELRRAEELSRSGQNIEAIDVYTKILEQHPDCAEAWQQRGTLYFSKADRFDDALQDLEKFISLRPDDPNAYTDRACLYRYAYFESGKEFLLLLAIDDFTQAIELGKPDPTWCEDHLSSTHFTRGTCYLDLKNYAPAVDDFTHCVDLDEKPTSTAFECLAQAYVGIRKYSEALQAVNRAITISDDDPEPVVLRAEIHRLLGDLAASESDVKRIEDFGKTGGWSSWIGAIRKAIFGK